MKVLVSGGGGFVMANFPRHWLEADPKHQAVAIDASTLWRDTDVPPLLSSFSEDALAAARDAVPATVGDRADLNLVPLTDQRVAGRHPQHRLGGPHRLRRPDPPARGGRGR